MKTTYTTGPALATRIPNPAPEPILPKNVGKTARIKLTRDVWPNSKLTVGDRLYAEQVVILPEKEARMMVENRQAQLVWEPGEDEEVPPEQYGKITR